MSQKPIISVDIDDVLSLSTKDILDYANKRWGHANTIEEFSEDLATMWQIDADEAERRWIEYINSGVMEKYDVLPEALGVLHHLKRRYSLIAVTSRRTVMLDLTHEWINANYPDVFETIHAARIYGEGKENALELTKGDVLRELGVSYHIDDQPKHCIGANDVGVTAVLFGDYPWVTRAVVPEEIIRCPDWLAVKEFFDKWALSNTSI